MFCSENEAENPLAQIPQTTDEKKLLEITGKANPFQLE